MHRVDDWRSLDAPTFCLLVESLAHHPGALRARFLRELKEEEGGGARPDRTVDSSVALADLANEGLVAWKR